MVRIPSSRTPTHPGEMLLEEFLVPMKLTQRELATAIHVPYQRVNDIVNGRRGITPSTALRLAKYFGTSPDFWMNLQLRWDLFFAQNSEAQILKEIQPNQNSRRINAEITFRPARHKHIRRLVLRKVPRFAINFGCLGFCGVGPRIWV